MFFLLVHKGPGKSMASWAVGGVGSASAALLAWGLSSARLVLSASPVLMQDGPRAVTAAGAPLIQHSRSRWGLGVWFVATEMSLWW